MTRLVEMIRIDKNEPAATQPDNPAKKESAYKDLAAYFPYFLWCLRDFTLDLQKLSSE